MGNNSSRSTSSSSSRTKPPSSNSTPATKASTAERTPSDAPAASNTNNTRNQQPSQQASSMKPEDQILQAAARNDIRKIVEYLSPSNHSLVTALALHHLTQYVEQFGGASLLQDIKPVTSVQFFGLVMECLGRKIPQILIEALKFVQAYILHDPKAGNLVRLGVLQKVNLLLRANHRSVFVESLRTARELLSKEEIRQSNSQKDLEDLVRALISSTVIQTALSSNVLDEVCLNLCLLESEVRIGKAGYDLISKSLEKYSSSDRKLRVHEISFMLNGAPVIQQAAIWFLAFAEIEYSSEWHTISDSFVQVQASLTAAGKLAEKTATQAAIKLQKHIPAIMEMITSNTAIDKMLFHKVSTILEDMGFDFDVIFAVLEHLAPVMSVIKEEINPNMLVDLATAKQEEIEQRRIEASKKKVDVAENWIQELSKMTSFSLDLQPEKWNNGPLMTAMERFSICAELKDLMDFATRVKQLNECFEAALSLPILGLILGIPAAKIDPEHFVESVLENVSAMSSSWMQQFFMFQLEGNDAIDFKGVTKEVMFLFFEEVKRLSLEETEWLINDDQLQTLWPSPLADPKKFQVIGRMLGMAFTRNIQVEFPLAKPIWKLMLGKPLTFEDLDDICHNFVQTHIKSILSTPDVSDLELYFSRQISSTCVDLVQGGSDIQVTESNKKDYLLLLSNWVLGEGIRKQLEALVTGFWEAVPPQALMMFDETELGKCMLGESLQGLDVTLLKDCTLYKDCDENHPTVKWFWEVVAEMDASSFWDLFYFVTNLKRIPPMGLQALDSKFTIAIDTTASEEHIPSASVCSNMLKLPEYKTKSKLKEKLMQAITLQTGGLQLK